MHRLVLALVLSIGCGGGHAVAPPAATAPTPQPAPTCTLDPRCSGGGSCTASSCGPGLVCQSDIEARWNHCGAPVKTECPAGSVGDSCGNCFTTCRADADCAGRRCEGGLCAGPRTCQPDRPLPP